MEHEKIVIGKEEWCALNDLSLPAIKVKVDSGAQTSSIHAFNIKVFTVDGKKYVHFDIHPLQDFPQLIKSCQAPLVDERVIKSSNGTKEKRHVISTTITLGHQSWQIELTLTNRISMGYRMLLGREAMRDRVLINPDDSFCLGSKENGEVSSHYDVAPLNPKGKKIVLLASNPELYSNKRIMQAGIEHGHDMRFINIRHCFMNINALKPEVHYRGGEVLEVDAVIPRIRPSMTFYGCALVRQFQSAGAYCLNDTISISRSRDKLRSLQLLSDRNIDMPMTGFANSPLDTKEIIKMVGGAPLVVKLLEGAQGRGVVLAETSKAAETVINAFKSLQANILVQEFIKEAGGQDIRCFVINGKVVGAIQRTAADGEFRANIHLGGTASVVKLTAEEKKMAIKAAKAMNLVVAGVDIIRSSRGPLVLEINSSPGLEGIEMITGKDIAGLMIQAIEKNL